MTDPFKHLYPQLEPYLKEGVGIFGHGIDWFVFNRTYRRLKRQGKAMLPVTPINIPDALYQRVRVITRTIDVTGCDAQWFDVTTYEGGRWTILTHKHHPHLSLIIGYS